MSTPTDHQRTITEYYMVETVEYCIAINVGWECLMNDVNDYIAMFRPNTAQSVIVGAKEFRFYYVVQLKH